MIIKDWDDSLIVTDNVLTNLPISQLSTITITSDGIGRKDLLLISKPCDPSEMTDTGYMSYYATADDLEAWMADIMDIRGMREDTAQISDDLAGLLPYQDMLEKMSCDTSAYVYMYENGEYSPRLISAIYSSNGILLSSLGTFKFTSALSGVLSWYKLPSISAQYGYFNDFTTTNANITNLTVSNLQVDGGKYNQLSVLAQSAYDGIPTASKKPDYFYFTYPG